MDGAATFRRAFHLASPLFLSYYILQDPLGANIPKAAVALLFIGTATCIEVARMALGVRLFGMRPYEGARVSAYYQGLVGLAFGLFVVQDPRIVVPVFLGMAWVDPLAAFARKRGWRREIFVVAYAAVFLGAELAMGSFGVPYAVAYAGAATAAATFVEGPKIPNVDDDLLMQVVPMILMVALIGAFGTGLASP